MTLQSSSMVQFSRSPKRMSVASVDRFTTQEEFDQEKSRLVAADANLADIKSMLSQIAESVDDYEIRRQGMMSELQAVSIELAVAVAAKMVYHEIQNAHDMATPMVKQLVAGLDRRVECKVWVHPDDLALLQETVLNDEQVNTGNIEFQIDPSLGRGDCRVFNGTDEFISAVHVKLAEIRHHLMESLKDAEVERRRTEVANRGIRRFPDRRATG